MILFLSVFNEKIISDTIMFIEKIKTIITSSSTTILSVGSFSERIDMVYDILDQAFPETSALAAVYGPITSLGDFISRTEIDPLLQVLKTISETGHKYVSTDRDLNSVLDIIYELVEE